MTAEITLRGRVLPIGGLRRSCSPPAGRLEEGAVSPEENARISVDIPQSVKNELEIVPVARMEEVLKHASSRNRRQSSERAATTPYAARRDRRRT